MLLHKKDTIEKKQSWLIGDTLALIKLVFEQIFDMYGNEAMQRRFWLAVQVDILQFIGNSQITKSLTYL